MQIKLPIIMKVLEQCVKATFGSLARSLLLSVTWSQAFLIIFMMSFVFFLRCEPLPRYLVSPGDELIGSAEHPNAPTPWPNRQTS